MLMFKSPSLKLKAAILIKESNLVKNDSMAVLEEFEAFEEGVPGENDGDLEVNCFT
jgi:hypothetical protein